MKKSKEYKLCVVFSCIALVLFSVSIVTGLISGLVYSIDKICGGLGFSCFCLGLLFLYKSNDKIDNKEK